MKLRKLFFLLLIVALAGCNLPSGGDETPTNTISPSDGILTAAAQTVEAQINQAGPSATAPPAAASDVDAPSPTTAPVETTTPVVADTATSIPLPCDLAEFVSDVTIPDGTVMPPGDAFTKTWRLKNIGTCTWDTEYSLVFDSGEAMGGPAAKQLTPGNVAPGSTVDISVNLIAPVSPDTYRGNWKLRNASNVVFGLGGDSPFYVEIVIEEISPTATETTGLNFSIAYAETWDCDTNSRVSFKIENTGDTPIESMQIRVEAPVGNYLNGFSNNAPFRIEPPETHPACVQAGTDSLGVGGILWVGVNVSPLPDDGSGGRVIIEMCSEDDLNGDCKEITFDFVW